MSVKAIRKLRPLFMNFNSGIMAMGVLQEDDYSTLLQRSFFAVRYVVKHASDTFYRIAIQTSRSFGV